MLAFITTEFQKLKRYSIILVGTPLSQKRRKTERKIAK